MWPYPSPEAEIYSIDCQAEQGRLRKAFLQRDEANPKPMVKAEPVAVAERQAKPKPVAAEPKAAAEPMAAAEPKAKPKPRAKKDKSAKPGTKESRKEDRQRSRDAKLLKSGKPVLKTPMSQDRKNFDARRMRESKDRKAKRSKDRSNARIEAVQYARRAARQAARQAARRSARLMEPVTAKRRAHLKRRDIKNDKRKNGLICSSDSDSDSSDSPSSSSNLDDTDVHSNICDDSECSEGDSFAAFLAEQNKGSTTPTAVKSCPPLPPATLEAA